MFPPRLVQYKYAGCVPQRDNLTANFRSFNGSFQGSFKGFRLELWWVLVFAKARLTGLRLIARPSLVAKHYLLLPVDLTLSPLHLCLPAHQENTGCFSTR